MKDDQIQLIMDGEAAIEYCGNVFDYAGERNGKHLFIDIENGTPLLVSDKALRNSSEFYFTYIY